MKEIKNFVETKDRESIMIKDQEMAFVQSI